MKTKNRKGFTFTELTIFIACLTCFSVIAFVGASKLMAAQAERIEQIR